MTDGRGTGKEEGGDGLLLGRLEQESSELDRSWKELDPRGMVRGSEVPLSNVVTQGLTLDLTA